MHYEFIGRWLLSLGWIVIFAGAIAVVVVWRNSHHAFRLRHVFGIGFFIRKSLVATLATGGLLVMMSALFGHFLSIDLTQNLVALDYAWPRGDMIIKPNERVDFKIVPFGNGKRCVLKVTTLNGVYTSEAILRNEGENLLAQISQRVQHPRP